MADISQALKDQGVTTKDPTAQVTKKADLPGLDVSALTPLGISGISNPDGQNDGLGFDATVHNTYIMGKVNAGIQAKLLALGLVDSSGNPTAALTAALNGTGGSGGTVAVTGVTLSPTTASLAVGATQQLTATVAPSTATNKNVTWSSSNTAIATVSTSGLVTAVAAGNATITVTTADGAKTATFALTVSVATGPTFRKLLSSDLATGNGSDGQALTQNYQVLADGSLTVVTAAQGRARLNLKLPAGTAGRIGFKSNTANQRTGRAMLRSQLTTPQGPSYQIRRGIRQTYSNKAQAVTWDGVATSSSDVDLGAIPSGYYLWIGRDVISGTPTIIYSVSATYDGALTQIGTDTDFTNNGDFWFGAAGDGGTGESDLNQVYTVGFISATS